MIDETKRFSNLMEGLTYDDVLLVPQYSEVESRSTVDLSVKLEKKGFGVTLANPIVPANMKTVTGYEMAKEIYKMGGLAIAHRFMPVEEQLQVLTQLEKEFGRMVWVHVGLSVGVKETDKEIVDYFVQNGVEIICIDVAHGDSKMCVDMTKYISTKYPEVFLISGNVATSMGTKRLLEAGADMVKVGIGPGSLCTTRIETGNGVPQLTALMLAHSAVEEFEYETGKRRLIMADGGIKNAGDCVKALCFADMVMVGNLFAGSEETPGGVTLINGKFYKDYVGSSTHKGTHIEGVSAHVPLKGHAKDIMQKLNEGIKSGCSYQGANNLTELKNKYMFMRITNASLRESHPHDVNVK